ncbi:MAG: M56 family metallopeptidase [Bacteroidaceae bacterium]|nr:M56 family metallopeptidase [Bacteroidaceae bacterium]
MLLFSIKSAFVLALLYVPYTLVLHKESFFRFNRMVLIGILLMSLLLPLCNFSVLSLDNHPVVHAAETQMVEVGIPISMSEEYVCMANADSHQLSWFDVVSIIYVVGMVVVLMFRIIQFVHMGLLIRKDCVWTEEQDGIKIYCHSDNIAPCSWMSSIIISGDDYHNNGNEIILHEKGHIRHHHSYDIILLTLVQMVQWWNPMSYMFGISLRDVHEYEADDNVLTHGVSAQSYQMLLIKKAVGSSSYAFANSFNHSLTKKRIAMMINKKSNPWMRTKALYALPVALIALSAFATPKLVNPIEEVVSELENRKAPVTSDIINSLSANEEKTEASIAETVAEMPTPSLKDQYDLDEVLILIDGKVATKEELAKLPKDANSVVIGYNIKAVKEQLRALGVLRMNILADNAIYVQKYGDKAKKAVVTIHSIEGRNNSKDDNFYLVSDMEPEFPGGKEELMKFVQNNLIYPEACLSNGVQGRVIVKFIVEADGTVTSPTIEQSVDHALDSVSLAMVKKMPKWRPALEDQKPVRREHSIPVTFRLQ